MNKIILSTVMGAALLSMGSAFAGGGNLFGGSGESSMTEGTFYGGASIGQTTTNCVIYDIAGMNKDCDMDSWKLFGGYKFTDNLAIEGGYYNFGDLEENESETMKHDVYGDVTAEMHSEGEATGLSIAGVASFQVADNFELSGKLGAMKYKSEATVTGSATNSLGDTVSETAKYDIDGTSLLWGVGAHYKFNDNWGVRGEYEGFTREDIHGDDQDVTMMSVGATFSTY
ncbi:MAG: outer membrane beta-barrel protein [Thiolinea sp.]